MEYIRGRAFKTVIDFKSLDAAQQWLTAVCNQVNVEECSQATVDKSDRIEEALSNLQPYPGEFGCFEIAEYKVDKQSTICIKNNHYSVPENLVGTSVLVKMYSEKIVIYDNAHKKVTSHERSYKTNRWVIDINHYVETLMKKTRALEQWDYRRFIASLLQREVDQRFENRKYQRIRNAKFLQMKYLNELVREELPADGRNLLPEFETLDFIKQGRNIVMYGNPGTGKTHIATGLGIKACLEGYNVYFTTVPHLLTEIREAKTEKTLQSLENKFRRYDLVICDEMGYVSFDKEGAELLFNQISLRSGTKATIITTNLPFTRWDEIIKR